MGKTWILDTDTKGTGAQMRPLEAEAPRRAPELNLVKLAPRRRAGTPAPEPAEPTRFRVVDAVSRELLADSATSKEAVAALEEVRSVVDVSVYVRDRGQWRPLTLGERKLLWSFRGHGLGDHRSAANTSDGLSDHDRQERGHDHRLHRERG